MNSHVDSLFNELNKYVLRNDIKTSDDLLTEIESLFDTLCLSDRVKYLNAKYYIEAYNGHRDKSLEFAINAYNLSKGLEKCSSQRMNALYNIMSIFVEEKKYEFAEKYLNDLLLQNDLCNESDKRNLLLLYQTKAYISYTSGQYDKGLNDNLYIISLADGTLKNFLELGITYYNLAGCCLQIGDIVRARTNYQKAINLFNRDKINSLSRRMIWQSQIKLSEIFISLNQFNLADSILSNAKESLFQDYWLDRYFFNQSLISKHLLNQGKYESDIKNFFIHVDNRFNKNPNDFYYADLIASYFSKIFDPLDSEIDKGECLVLFNNALFTLTDNNFQISNIEQIDTKSIRNYPIFIKLIDAFISFQLKTTTRPFNYYKYFEIRNQAIFDFYLRYGDNSIFLQNTDNFRNNLYSILLNSNNYPDSLLYLLIAEIQSSLLNNKLFVQNSALNRELQVFRNRIVFIEEQIARVKIRSNRELSDKDGMLFRLNDSLDCYRDQFSKLYDINFYKTNNEFHNFFSSLNPTIILFDYNNSFIRIFFDIKDTSLYIDQLDSNFSDNVKILMYELNSLITNRVCPLDSSINNFLNVSFKLFSQLFYGINFNELDYLNIVPNGSLISFPFELLITEGVNSLDSYQWSKIPFLFKSLNIGYLYSLRDQSNNVNVIENKSDIIAFAPSYNISPLDSYRISNLQNNRNEIMEISSYFEGKYYLSKCAIKKTFLTEAHKYKIIHLATHAVANTDNPLLSRIFFSNNSKDSTDFTLYPFEIQNLTLNSDLVVLSSCESGIGKFYESEGVYSLARSFFIAGANSVVSSLWKVDDYSSSKLMKYFYENLRKGYSKTLALRKAKLKYLETSDSFNGNPYFWSGFIVIGDDAPVVIESNDYNLLKILISILILSVFMTIVLFKMRIIQL